MRQDMYLDRLARGEVIDHAVFYSRVKDSGLLSTLEFYAEDIQLLNALANRVTVCTSLSELRAADPGPLWAWWHSTSLAAVIVWKIRRLPVIVTGAVDLSNPLEGPILHRVKRQLTRLASRLADLNVAISEYERSDLERLAPRAVTRTLHPGVDCDFYKPARPSESPTLCMVAQINPPSISRKGIDLVVDAFRLVRQEHATVQLSIIGPISEEGQRWIDEREAAGDLAGIAFLGRVDRDVKRSMVASSWAYLQPSRYEGFGLAVAEAMACGVTPIVTAAGALPEVVGDVGVITGAGPDEISRAVLQVLATPPTVERQTAVAASAQRFASSTREQRARSIIDRD